MQRINQLKEFYVIEFIQTYSKKNQKLDMQIELTFDNAIHFAIMCTRCANLSEIKLYKFSQNNNQFSYEEIPL